MLADGVKLDNLIQIAHTYASGDHTAMAGCTAIAGSTRIRGLLHHRRRASIVGHLTIADHVHIGRPAP